MQAFLHSIIATMLHRSQTDAHPHLLSVRDSSEPSAPDCQRDRLIEERVFSVTWRLRLYRSLRFMGCVEAIFLVR